MSSVHPRKIQGETARVLVGSEYVRDKLLSLLSVGPRSISSKYYAIKSRVKSEESISQKVQRKKTLDNKPSYSVDSITDIV